MVESGGLENRCALIRTVGSNPTLSARSKSPRFMRGFLLWCCGGFEPKQKVRTATQVAMIDLQVNPVRGETHSVSSIPPSPQKGKPPKYRKLFCFLSIKHPRGG